MTITIDSREARLRRSLRRLGHELADAGNGFSIRRDGREVHGASDLFGLSLDGVEDWIKEQVKREGGRRR